MRVFADFDGTVAVPDVTDLVLQRLAPALWEEIERAWLAGEIDAATCMRRQIALLDADPALLHEVLDSVELDPAFPAFAAWCESEGVRLSIVSDGVDYFIQRILDRHQLGDIPVFANAFGVSKTHYTLTHPWFEENCAAKQGVCKCAVTGDARSPLIYVGDGRSDQCVARRADILFAKKSLATFCAGNSLAFTPFETFADVQAALIQRADRALFPPKPTLSE
jgi:2,3-diketo-5-methylthio-1-phosphopentane phosphatase